MSELFENNELAQSTVPEISPQEESTVSPDQISMFDDESNVISLNETVSEMSNSANTELNSQEEPTRMEIPMSSDPMYRFESEPTETNVSETDNATESAEEGEFNNIKKFKILAALIIVAIAGYIAYWVQEPAFIKADLTSSDVSKDLNDNESDLSGSSSNTVLSESSDKTYNVDVSLFGFEPATLKIEKNSTVIWTNTSTEEQTIVGASENGDSFVSPVIASGESYSKKFEQEAVFTYYSTYNPALKASITVENSVSSSDNTDVPLSKDTNVDSENFDFLHNTADKDDGLKPVSSTDALDNLNLERETASEIIADNKNSSFANETSEQENKDNSLYADMNLKSAADENSPSNLSKTGPEDILYIFIILGIGFLNRKKLAAALRRY